MMVFIIRGHEEIYNDMHPATMNYFGCCTPVFGKYRQVSNDLIVEN